MPCLNEAETLEACIRKAARFLAASGISGEIVIGDNGSTDGSIELAGRHGARVVNVPVRRYGAVVYHAALAAGGRFVIVGDSDDSCDFSALGPFIEKLREGYDLVVGNRFQGGIRSPAPCHGKSATSAIRFSAASVACFSIARRGISIVASAGFSIDAFAAWISAPPVWSLPSKMVYQIDIVGNAHRGGANHPRSRWPIPPPSPPSVARRLASSAIHVSLQPPLALRDPRPG